MDRDLKRIEQKIDRINAKLTALNKNISQQQHWVKVGIIQSMTGWNNKALEKARNNGLIQFKRDGNSIVYLIESIPDMFIVSKKI